jgi:RHS repeat-associated protein
MPSRVYRLACCLLVVCFLAVVTASAQDVEVPTSAADAGTPSALAPGSHPLGSFGGSDFDSVNLFNGNLSMTIPLASTGGRNGAGVALSLSYNSKIWRTERRDIYTQGSDTPTQHRDWAVNDLWDAPEPLLRSGWKLTAGRMFARRSGYLSQPSMCGTTLIGHHYARVMTRLTFTAPDGTEYEFRDDAYDGQPLSVALSGCGTYTGQSRGKVWHSTDGTAATFVSDAPIFDTAFGPQQNPDLEAPMSITGWVFLRDGTRMRVVASKVVSRQDRNGNVCTFGYDAQNRIVSLLDSLGRVITVAYRDTTALGPGVLVRVSYPGTGGVTRNVYVLQGDLDTALNSGSILDGTALFSGLEYTAGPFNPKVIKGVVLPSGHQWAFKYNPRGEVTRVETPAGGAIEYQMGGVGPDGVTQVYGVPQIFRRIAEREVYPDGVTLEGRTVYGDPTTSFFENPQPETQDVIEEQLSPSGARLAATRHTFYGTPLDNYRNKSYGVGYEDPITGTTQSTNMKPWREGRELRTASLGATGSDERQVVDTTWEQGTSVDWVSSPSPSPTDPNQPDGNPRVKETKTTLNEPGQSGSLVTKTEIAYDANTPFNNVQTETVYDFGPGAPGARTRQSYKSYVVDPAYTDVYPSSLATTYHLRSLVATAETRKWNGSSWVAESRGSYEYDNYGASAHHAPLDEFPFSPSNPTRDPNFNTGTTTKRGNVTMVTVGMSPDTPVKTYLQYDTAGNVVAKIAPRADEGGAIEARHTVAVTYDTNYDAFPIHAERRVTRADGQELTLETDASFDTATGNLLSTTGANDEVTTYSYTDPGTGQADLLDRVMRVTRPAGAGYTTFAYSAAGSPLSMSETTQFAGATTVWTTTKFDGLMRVEIKERKDAGAGGKAIAETEYDGMGRPWRVTNPHLQSTVSPTDGSTETTFDLFGRVTAVTTKNAAGAVTGVVSTEYVFNEVTVEDQANNERWSKTDAAGRLVEVREAPNDGTYNYRTTYGYDARGNLLTVTQGVGTANQQTRTFTYDTFGRLKTAQMPETVGTTSYTYDLASNLKTRLDPRGITTTFAYDEMNRVLSKTYSGTTADTATPNVKYVYDDSGLPAGVTAPTGWTTFDRGVAKGRLVAVMTMASSSAVATYTMRGYDAPGRLVRTRQMVDATSYDSSATLNEGGAPVTETYPSLTGGPAGTVMTPGYNAAGQLQSLTRTPLGQSATTLASGVLYGPTGVMTQQALGSGAGTLYHRIRYNSRQQPDLISLGTSTSNADRLELAYTYGEITTPNWVSNPTPNPSINSTTANNGNIAKITISPGGGTPIEQYYAYDPLNRLLKAVEYYEPAGSAPAAPTSLTATAVSSSQINLAWIDNSNNETGFEVERAASSSGPWTLLGTTVAGATTYQSTSLSASTTYYYRVRATIGGSNDSVNSNTANATTQAAGAPAAPTSLTAIAVSSSQINLTWTDNSTNETGFEVERATSSSGPWTLLTTTAAGAVSYQSTGLSASTTYYYRVRATIGGTNDSANSNTANATTQAVGAPAAPTNLAATAVSSSQINLAWTDNSTNETGFEVERGTTSLGPWVLLTTTAAGAVSYQSTGLTASTTYYYRVRATIGGTNDSANSNTANATTQAAASDFALGVSGAGFEASAADTASLSQTGAMTVEAWVRPSVLGVKQVVVSKRGADGAGATSFGGYELRINASGQVAFVTYNNAGTAVGTAQSAGTVGTANQWYHIAGTVTVGGQVTAYLNAVGGTPTAGAVAANGNQRLQLGRALLNGAGQDPFSGRIDEVRISNVVRTITTGTSHTTDANTMALWKMQTTNGLGTGADSSGIATPNHLTTLTGTSWVGGVTSSGKRKRAAVRRVEGEGAIAGVLEGIAGSTSAEADAETAAGKTAAATTVSWTQDYACDTFGNMTMSTGPSITISKATNRITTPGYVYDNSGNVTADPNGKTYFYDAENRLWQVKQGTTVLATFVYDGEGQRVRKNVPAASPTTTRFLYGMGGSLVAEYAGTSTFALAKEYAHGASGLLAAVDVSGSTHTVNYLTPDHLGTPRILTNAAGGVVSRHDYKPFGEEIGVGASYGRTAAGYGATDTVRQAFTGYQRDVEIGLDFAQARYFSPGQGRFSSCDPLLESAAPSNPKSWNRYVYALNSPLRFVDRTGLYSTDPGWRKEITGLGVLGPDTYSFGETEDIIADAQGDTIEAESSQDGLASSGATEIVASPSKTELALDVVQAIISVAGFVPALGDAGDGVNAGISLLRGNYSDAAVDGLSAVTGPFGNIMAVGMRGRRIWSATHSLTPVENAFQHWTKHSDEFANLGNSKQYVEAAHEFLNNPPPGALVKVRSNGETVIYDPATKVFGVRMADGTPRTMFKPDPAKHGYSTNEDYFNAQ